MSAAIALATPAAAPRQRTALQRKCACGQAVTGIGAQCEDCQRRQLFGIGPTAAPGTATPADPGPGPGQSLDVATRGFFEARFGHGFGDVRIHAGDRAAAAARALNAHAYTSGRDIVFARGRYEPQSAPGQRLLAHELTHVVQQRSGLAAAGPVDEGSAEQEAEHNAARLHTAQPLHAVQRAPALARQAQAAVQAPLGPPGCTLDQHRAIEPAVLSAQARLQRVADRLDAYLQAPAHPGQQRMRAALDRHFHRSDAVVAGRVRARLLQIRTDMTSLTPLTTECHDGTDRLCANFGAYVQNRQQLVFCPNFFAQEPDSRQGLLIHEMAHALQGLRITDRAYRSDRLLPYLSAAEALDNADSYEMFTHDVDIGDTIAGTSPQDEVDDCAVQEPLVREAIARAERWNRDADTVSKNQDSAARAHFAPLFTAHLGNDLPATRASAGQLFDQIVRRLREPIDVRCDSTATANCSPDRHAYKQTVRNTGRYASTGGKLGSLLGLVSGGTAALATGVGLLGGLGLLGLGGLIGVAIGGLFGLLAGSLTSRPVVHVCPSWAAQPTVEDRTESLVAAVYESYGGLSTASSRRHAALARAIQLDIRHTAPPV